MGGGKEDEEKTIKMRAEVVGVQDSGEHQKKNPTIRHRQQTSDDAL